MSLKDKLEIGLKPDAPYRPDNLPEHQLEQVESRKREAKRARKVATPAKRATRPRPRGSR